MTHSPSRGAHFNLKTLLQIKQATIQMAMVSNYDVKEDEPVLDYESRDMESYFEYAYNTVESNIVRRALKYGDNDKKIDLLNERSCLSTFYESKSKPNHYIVFYFIPQQADTKSQTAGVNLITPIISLCRQYPPSAQRYCADCLWTLNSFSRCLKCPLPQYCASCENTFRCDNCVNETKMCSTCTTKAKKMYTTNEQEEVEYCDNCPQQTYCYDCQKTNIVKPCKKCPVAPQIIERCVIISEKPLTPDATNSAAAASVPRIHATTGEWVSYGCLTQVYMDYDLFYNPLVHSLGSRYQVMTTTETVDFFRNKNNTVTESQLFQMDMAAPVAKYLGLYPGKLLRIERDILVPGTIITHEVVYRLIRLIPLIRKNRRRSKKESILASGAKKEEEEDFLTAE